MKIQHDSLKLGMTAFTALLSTTLPAATALAQAPVESQAIETIVVEARRFAEPINETPLAVTGLYYFDESDITPDGVFGPEADISFFGIPGFEQGLSTASTNDLETESLAVFGEVTLPLAENMELTAGARYTSASAFSGAAGAGQPIRIRRHL